MFSEEVKTKITEILNSSAPVDLFDKNKLVLNLVFMHQVITATEDLMKCAIGEYRDDTKFDDEFNIYMQHHLSEESNHAEWLASDLKNNGIDLKSYPLMRKAVEMAGTQYYLIKHVHPVSILGYMAVLEGFPIGLDMIEQLEEKHSRSLLNTLRYHAEHDLEHREEVFSMIDEAPTDMQEFIMQSAIQTAVYIVEVTHQWHNLT
jgi:hypothetical protein